MHVLHAQSIQGIHSPLVAAGRRLARRSATSKSTTLNKLKALCLAASALQEYPTEDSESEDRLTSTSDSSSDSSCESEHMLCNGMTPIGSTQHHADQSYADTVGWDPTDVPALPPRPSFAQPSKAPHLATPTVSATTCRPRPSACPVRPTCAPPRSSGKAASAVAVADVVDISSDEDAQGTSGQELPDEINETPWKRRGKRVANLPAPPAPIAATLSLMFAIPMHTVPWGVCDARSSL